MLTQYITRRYPDIQYEYIKTKYDPSRRQIQDCTLHSLWRFRLHLSISYCDAEEAQKAIVENHSVLFSTLTLEKICTNDFYEL